MVLNAFSPSTRRSSKRWKLVKSGKVRRARLYYLRGRRGKAARLKEAGRDERARLRVFPTHSRETSGSAAQILPHYWRTSEQYVEECSRRRKWWPLIARQSFFKKPKNIVLHGKVPQAIGEYLKIVQDSIRTTSLSSTPSGTCTCGKNRYRKPANTSPRSQRITSAIISFLKPSLSIRKS